MTTLTERLDKLPPERREKVAARARELVAKERPALPRNSRIVEAMLESEEKYGPDWVELTEEEEFAREHISPAGRVNYERRRR